MTFRLIPNFPEFLDKPEVSDVTILYSFIITLHDKIKNYDFTELSAFEDTVEESIQLFENVLNKLGIEFGAQNQIELDISKSVAILNGCPFSVTFMLCVIFHLFHQYRRL